MRHVEDLRRGAIAEVDAVITIAHRMPFETGKCDELARLIRRIHRRKIIAPGSAGALETAAMIIHQIVQAWIALWHVVPMPVQGNAGEIQLQAGIMQCLVQRAFAVTQRAMVVNITVIQLQI